MRKSSVESAAAKQSKYETFRRRETNVRVICFRPPESERQPPRHPEIGWRKRAAGFTLRVKITSLVRPGCVQERNPAAVKYNELFITLPCFYLFFQQFSFFLFIFEFQPTDQAPELAHQVPPVGLAATDRSNYLIFTLKKNRNLMKSSRGSWCALVCRGINLREAADSRVIY